MKTLKYALLGQIVQGPKSGYDLMQIFGEDLAHTWYASHSQIYPELRKMVSEGLVEYKTEIQGKVLEKKVYSATEKGRKEFQAWMTHIDDIPSSPKDEFRLKLMYLNCASPEALLPHVLMQKKYRTARMNKLKAALQQYPEQPKDLESLGNYLALTGSMMREQSYLEWLDICCETLSALSAK